MKVVLLAPLPPPSGGIASWAVRMLNTKLKNDWKVEIVDEKLIGRSSHGDNNKKKLLVELKRCFNIWKNLIRELKDPEAIVVHACTAATTTGMLRDSASCVITHFFRRKYIIHFRCTIPNLMKSPLKRFVCNMLCRISDVVIVLNEESREYVSNISRSRVELVPNFVEDSVIEENKDRLYHPIVKRILYTGGVTIEKGCAEIIEAAKSFPDIQFRLVGNIRKEISELDKPSNVLLTGVQSKVVVQEEINAADLFIFFTHMDSEGFANSLVEAMAAGLPCIVTDWSANAEMIEDKGGVVLPIHDIKGLIGAIEGLKDDEKARSKFGKWNIQKVRNEYSESVITGKYVDIYESITR
ncbi:glycosyltransferase family 4 protein [Priestia sp. D3YE.R1]|uniref:glycosyltransferase family 4 protein n=1 Tax=Priestia sp. D3YE.R1 TaxID=3400416 RepID=UPI003B9F9596